MFNIPLQKTRGLVDKVSELLYIFHLGCDNILFCRLGGASANYWLALTISAPSQSELSLPLETPTDVVSMSLVKLYQS